MDSNSQNSSCERRRRTNQSNDEEPELSLGATIGIGAIGIAALGLGAAAIYKSFFSNDNKNHDKNTPGKREIVFTEIPYTNNFDRCGQQLRAIETDIKEHPVIGLDCQWTQKIGQRGVCRNPIALLQLATYQGNVLLFQFKKFTSIPAALKNLLRNENIIKVGIGGTDDKKYLYEDHDLEVNSTFDLRFLAEERNYRPEGLEGLSKSVLNVDLPNRYAVLSNWDDDLDSDQIEYAESAAKASIDIFEVLYSSSGRRRTKGEFINYCQANLNKSYTFYSQKHPKY